MGFLGFLVDVFFVGASLLIMYLYWQYNDAESTFNDLFCVVVLFFVSLFISKALHLLLMQFYSDSPLVSNSYVFYFFFYVVYLVLIRVLYSMMKDMEIFDFIFRRVNSIVDVVLNLLFAFLFNVFFVMGFITIFTIIIPGGVEQILSYSYVVRFLNQHNIFTSILFFTYSI